MKLVVTPPTVRAPATRAHLPVHLQFGGGARLPAKFLCLKDCSRLEGTLHNALRVASALLDPALNACPMAKPPERHDDTGRSSLFFGGICWCGSFMIARNSRPPWPRRSSSLSCPPSCVSPLHGRFPSPLALRDLAEPRHPCAPAAR